MTLIPLQILINNKSQIWIDSLTNEFDFLSMYYDGSNSALLASKTYAAITNDIAFIMQANNITDYKINASLHDTCDGGAFTADFVISYINNDLETETFNIETEY